MTPQSLHISELQRSQRPPQPAMEVSGEPFTALRIYSSAAGLGTRGAKVQQVQTGTARMFAPILVKQGQGSRRLAANQVFCSPNKVRHRPQGHVGVRLRAQRDRMAGYLCPEQETSRFRAAALGGSWGRPRVYPAATFENESRSA